MSLVPAEQRVNHVAVDGFTAAHFGAGVALGYLALPAWLALVAAVGWELIENPLKDRYPQAFPHASHDTFANAATDACALMAGWAFARWVVRRSGRERRRRRR